MKNKIQVKNTFFQNGSHPAIEINQGVILNLLSSKGANTKGKSKFVVDMKTFLQEPNKDDVTDNIIFCNFLEHAHYPILSALSAAAVITFSMNYDDYVQLMVVNSAIGVFGGFGNLSFNSEISKFLTSIDGKEIYVDTLYNRIILPDSKLPEELSNYEFDLGDIFSYK